MKFLLVAQLSVSFFNTLLHGEAATHRRHDPFWTLLDLRAMYGVLAVVANKTVKAQSAKRDLPILS